MSSLPLGGSASVTSDSVQKRLAHYFESGERRNWSATDFIGYLDTLYADCTTVGEARLQLHKLRQRANEPFTEFLVRFESQLAKADRLNIPDIGKIELLQVALHTGFDARCNSVGVEGIEVPYEIGSGPVAPLTGFELSANEPFTEFLVRFESQLAKADRLNIPDIDKIELLQVALHTGFDARCNSNADIPTDNYAEAVAAYKAAAAKDRALELRSALRRMPASSTTAGPSKDPEGDTVMTGVASAGFAGKGKAKAKAKARVAWVSKDMWEGRRSLGQCLRCGADDHQIRECGMLPAFRPAAAAGVHVLEAESNDVSVSESENDHP
ncbi:hypothetical protein E4U19_006290 [Claviceps sp. Clav32 group G5]|nr:hypothetical protein E4U19_006290 [Claviceps sp. Clav32 group G5]